METRGRRTVSAERAELLRKIPSVDELLLQPRLAALSKRADRNLVVEVTRAALADLRARITGDSNWTAISLIRIDRKSTRLNSSHANISYAVFCLKKKKKTYQSKLQNK